MALADDMSGAAAIAVTVLAVSGAVPSQTDYARLVAFGKEQFNSYASMGVANPSLGPFEALGRSYAADSVLKTTFASINGKGPVSDFIDSAYQKVFGKLPAAAAKAALTSQVSYFEGLYRGAGITAADALLQAKGAVFGQIIGYAFTDATAGSKSGLDDVVNAIVAKANAGDFSGLGGQLPPYKATNDGTVVIVPKGTLDTFTLDTAIKEIFVANPSFYGNGLEKFVVGQDKIDLKAFAFGPNVTLAALSKSGGSDATFYTSEGKQYAAVINSGGLFVDVNGNGRNDPVGDYFLQLVGTQGNPGTSDLIFV